MNIHQFIKPVEAIKREDTPSIYVAENVIMYVDGCREANEKMRKWKTGTANGGQKSMKRNHEYPKYALGEAWPSEPHSWVIRLRPTLMLAMVEERGLFGMHLHCWPAGAEKTIKPRMLAHTVGEMAALWSEEIEHLSGLPSRWSFEFHEDFKPPDRIVIDAIGAEWTGILEPSRGILWSVEDWVEGAVAIRWVREFGGQPEFPADTRAIETYFRRYCEAEDIANTVLGSLEI